MKICIYGAGAIGGYLGVQLARAGVEVSLVARGAHLAAMKANGLKLLIGDEEHVAFPRQGLGQPAFARQGLGAATRRAEGRRRADSDH